MSNRTNHFQLRRVVLLSALLILALHFPGESSHAASPSASSITLSMSNPTCFRVLPANGACSVQINSLAATGSDPSFARIEILVNGKLRVYVGGFFEATGYLTSHMLPGGLMVACGRLNEGGSPNFGRAYTVTANAYMVDNTSATDSMTVLCPAFEGKTFIPMVRNRK